jgi:hypothetical protein
MLLSPVRAIDVFPLPWGYITVVSNDLTKQAVAYPRDFSDLRRPLVVRLILVMYF